ncbi:MAG TPA: hypothetical protein RMH99_04120 [Sandaracinaceae bacterium LLY-WYZ-13_1]|nr:hypothetical protein [Sandaracinaceae bacterium LLY-WYZ-13_1]
MHVHEDVHEDVYVARLRRALKTLPSREWFCDRKPEAYALEGERERLSTEEIMAMFSGG